MLSMNSRTSCPFSSRKYSVIARPEQRHAKARARRLVHLAVDQRDLRGAEVLLVDDACLRHLVVEVVALARALADAGEHRDPAVELGDVVDELHDDDRLADAGAAKGADLAALQKGANQIDDLDARGQHLRRRRLIRERRRRTMDRIVLLRRDRSALVHRTSGDIEDAAHHAFADRHRDRSTPVGHLDAALEPLGARHGDRPDPLVAEMLLHLEGERDRPALHRVVHGERVEDGWKRVGKFDVHHRAGDLNDFADVHVPA